jgi:cell division protein FtsZ
MLEFDLPKDRSQIIKVIGVGGGGGNAVNHMFNQGIEGVDFIVCNTDQQALDRSPVPIKIQLGASLTNGLGAGSRPEVGKNAAIESIDEVREILEKNTTMVFITAGMGGGTGTGAAPVIAKTAREMGILTVGIVTLPFTFEGKRRNEFADDGIAAMRENCDTLLVIKNDKLRQIFGNLSMTDAFSNADNVLTTAAKGIAEVITKAGQVNMDMNDVITAMKDSGVAVMGSATANGERRAVDAIEQALESPLLNDNDIEGAKHILLNISYGNSEISMDEFAEITDYIEEVTGNSAQEVKWGICHDDVLGDDIRVTIIATGFKTTQEQLDFDEKNVVKRVLDLEDVKPIFTPVTSPTRSFTKPNSSSQTTNNSNSGSDEPYLKPTKPNPVNEEKEQPSLFGTEFDMTNETKSPEVDFTDSKPEKPKMVVHVLDDEDEYAPKSKSSEAYNKPAASPEDQQRLSNERINKIRELTLKLKTPSGINDLENVPAYMRRNIKLENVNHSSESSVSKYSLNEEQDERGNKRVEIRRNNSFLHDNVD